MKFRQIQLIAININMKTDRQIQLIAINMKTDRFN